MDDCSPGFPCRQAGCPFCADDHQAPAEPSRAEQLAALLIDTDGLDHIPDPDPLIGSEVLFMDCLAWMVGKPGCGKSFTSLDMAGCVGTGEPWQGYRVRQGPVLYLVAEGVRGVKKRVRAWEKSMGRRMANVHFLPVAVQSKDAGAWAALVEVVRELRPVMIVIDTQARVTVGVEENSNTEMGGFVHQAERLRIASGACVLIVHHIGRNGDTGRGATTLDGAMSTVIKVTKEAELMTLECQKNKDGEEWEPIHLRTVATGDSLVLMLTDGLPGGSSGVPPWIRTWWEVFEGDWVSVTTLIDAGVVAKTSFHRAKLPLVRAGVVEVRGESNATRYRLPKVPV